MKVLNYLAMVAIMLVAVACSEEENTVDNKAIAGDYAGNVTMTVAGSDAGAAEVSMKLVEGADGKLSVVLPSVGFGKMVMPELTLNNVKANEVSANQVELKADTVTIPLNGKSYVAVFTGSIEGNELNADYGIKPGEMPMFINFAFLGNKK